MQPEPVAFEPSREVYMPVDHMEVAKVAILGVVAGLLVPLLALLIANYFIEPVFCRSAEAFSVCSNGGVIANHVAAIIVGMMTVALLANWGVYRPLLIVIAVTIVTWGLHKYLGPINAANWTEFFAFSAALYGLAYLAFYWLLRLKNFPVSLALTVLAAAVACWAIVA